jgi:hypothetical protein
MIARPLACCLAVGLVSCTSICVVPQPDLEQTLAATSRPALGFSFVESFDESLRNPDASPSGRQALEDESLAKATAAFRDALVGTEAFGAIEVASAGEGLHCAFDLRTIGGVDLGGILLALTVGLIPDRAYDYELIATVTAPGKEQRTYRARTSAGTLLWLPLAPMAIVHALTQRGGLQQTVDSIATQMAADGWLGR